MYSESESEENADNENEDQRHCLAVEVDNPEIDDIMRGVFGYENMLYEMCIYEICIMVEGTMRYTYLIKYNQLRIWNVDFQR